MKTLVVNAIERNICSLSLKCKRKLSVLNPSVLQPGCIMVLLRTCKNCVFLNACFPNTSWLTHMVCML